MHTHRQVLFLLILCLSRLVCSGQSLKFDNYSTKDGLPSESVYSLHQDRQGYIWVFTGNGTVKYNSVAFKPVLRNLPYNESFIFSVYENKEGRMWVANLNGKIYEVIRDSAFIVKGIEKTSELLRENVAEILKLYVDDSLNIYALTKKRSYCFVKKDGIYHTVELEVSDSLDFFVKEKGHELLPLNGLYKQQKDLVHYFVKTPYCKVAIQNNGRVDRFVVPTLKAPMIPKVFRKKGKETYFSFYDRLVHIDTLKNIRFRRIPGMINNFVIDKRGHVWVASFGGLFELNEKDSVVKRYFPEVAFNDVLLDSCNGLWASTARAGLLHCKDLNTLHFGHKGWQDGQIHFMKLLDNTLFAANVRGELYSLQHDTMRCVRRVDFQIPVLLDMIKLKSLYITSYQLYTEAFEIGKTKAGNVHAFSGHNPLKLIPLNAQDFLSMSRNTIELYTGTRFRKSYELGQKLFTSELWNGTLFFSTNSGVLTMDPASFNQLITPVDAPILKKIKLIQPAYLAPTKNVVTRRFVKDPAGHLWFCTMGDGLFRLSKDRTLTHFLMPQGLPSTIIHDIFFADSLVLLSTNTGLYLGKPGKGQEFPVTWKSIYGGDVTFGLMYEHKIYAVTQDGIVAIPPGASTGKKIYFNLAAVLINSKQVPREALSEIGHDQIVQLEFDLIDPGNLSGQRDTISYSISGDASESGILYDQLFTLQHFAPGNYVLTVVPHADRSKTIRLPLIIRPAFWQTLMFQVAAGMLFFLLVFFIARLLFLRFRKKEIKKLEAERLISEYKLTALKAQFNPHFMSNCLVAIQNLIYTGHVDKAGQYLAKFSAFMRKILDYSDKQYLTLEEEITVLRSYVELEQLRFKSDFNFELRVEKNIAISEVLIPSLITQPHVENAIWHGLLPLKERSPRLLIDIFTRERMLFLVITDNGVGRKKNQEERQDRTSKGTRLVNEQVLSLNTLHSNFGIRITITDLLDDKNLPAGTQITLQLPIYTLDE